MKVQGVVIPQEVINKCLERMAESPFSRSVIVGIISDWAMNSKARCYNCTTGHLVAERLIDALRSIDQITYDKGRRMYIPVEIPLARCCSRCGNVVEKWHTQCVICGMPIPK